MHVIAFTGHRLKDLPAGMSFSTFAKALDALGVGARTDIHFVAGGAVGVDTWAAEYALTRGLPLHLVLPFTPEVQGNRWPPHARETLAAHVGLADDVTILSDGPYDVAMLQARNVHMVDAADHVFAVWSGKPQGGTANCIRYALKVGKPTYNLWPLDGRLRPIKEVA